jgi:transposase-like protein
MGRNRRSFTIGFKQQVVAEIKSGQITLSGASRKYEIGYGTVESWVQRFEEGKLTGKAEPEDGALKAENERLKAKVGELTMEIDLLKKFNTWVQQRRKENTSVITGNNLAQFVGGAKCSK